MKKEIWKDIEGYEGYYQISNLDRVTSMDRTVNRSSCRGNMNIKGKLLKKMINTSGYKAIDLCVLGKRKAHRIHRLIATAFIPNPLNLPCVNHKDGNKLNNDISNLEWCTYSENSTHAHKTGLNKRAKLSKKDVEGIKMLSYSNSQKKVGEMYGVSATTVWRVLQGQSCKRFN